MENNIITREELQKKLNEHEPVFILDVRPTDQRNEWKIEESTHIDAYDQLKKGDHAVLDDVKIPSDATIVTVCAAGRTSLIASSALRDRGINAYSLEGGMKAWNYAWTTAEMELDNEVKVIQVKRTAKGVLSYIVGSAREAVVIDASLDPNVYIEIAKENNWTIKYVMDTHIHADYVSRSRDLAGKTDAKHLLLSKADVRFDFTPIANDESVKFGNSHIKFIHTPGHTWESTTFQLDDTALFTGDTLFIDGIGRPDLKAEQDEAVKKATSLFGSLQAISSLNGNLFVFPTHTSSSIAFDKKIVTDTLKNINNKLGLSKMKESEFVKQVTSTVPPTPANYLTIVELNKAGSHDDHELSELEAGGNHCAIG